MSASYPVYAFARHPLAPKTNAEQRVEQTREQKILQIKLIGRPAQLVLKVPYPSHSIRMMFRLEIRGERLGLLFFKHRRIKRGFPSLADPGMMGSE